MKADQATQALTTKVMERLDGRPSGGLELLLPVVMELLIEMLGSCLASRT